MAVVKRGESWQARISVRGRRVSQTFETRAEAEVWEAQQKALLLARANDPLNNSPLLWDQKKPVRTLKEAVEEAEEFQWADAKARTDLVRNAMDVAQIVGLDEAVTKLGDRETINLVDRTLRGRGLSGATINRKLAAYSMLCKRNDVTRPPLPFRKEVARRVRSISRQEQAAMMRWCRERKETAFRAWLVFSIGTGWRVSEVERLQARDVDFKRRTATTWETKNDEPRTTFMSRPVAAAAKTLLKANPTRQQTRDRWERMRRDLGLQQDPDFVRHVTRHTFCTRLGAAGVSLKTLMELSGHKDPDVALRYIHPDERTLREALRRGEQV